MAVRELTPALKLRVPATADADARYNLFRLDTLSQAVYQSSDGNVHIRSLGSINLVPNSADLGSTGVGGLISFGSPDQVLESVTFHADAVVVPVVQVDALELVNSYSVSTYLRAYPGVDQLTAVTWYLPKEDGNAGQVLGTDGQGQLIWVNATSGSLAGLSDVAISGLTDAQQLVYNTIATQWVNRSLAKAFDWFPAQGSQLSLTHNLGSLLITCQIIDEFGATVEISDVIRDSTNTIQLTAAEPPTGAWKVLLTVIP